MGHRTCNLGKLLIAKCLKTTQLHVRYIFLFILFQYLIIKRIQIAALKAYAEILMLLKH
jgi:hypothetical protein